MEMQVSHSICAEIQEEGILCREAVGNRRDTEETMQLVWSKYI